MDINYVPVLLAVDDLDWSYYGGLKNTKPLLYRLPDNKILKLHGDWHEKIISQILDKQFSIY